MAKWSNVKASSLLGCSMVLSLALLSGFGSPVEAQTVARRTPSGFDVGLGLGLDAEINNLGFVYPGLGRRPGPGLKVIDPSSSANAATIRSSFENSGDGSFQWGFESTDGTKSEQVGVLKGPDEFNPEGVQAVQGSYSYISPEGIPITVNYIADENGFRAVGDHIPTTNNAPALIPDRRNFDLVVPTPTPTVVPVPTPAEIEAPYLRNPGFLVQDHPTVDILGNPHHPFNTNRFGAGFSPEGFAFDNSLFSGGRFNGQNNPGVGVGFGFRNRAFP